MVQKMVNKELLGRAPISITAGIHAHVWLQRNTIEKIAGALADSPGYPQDQDNPASRREFIGLGAKGDQG
ncbi:hypothetical protein [Streptosporangium sp. NPDC049376]|uniref:hypothetical protein n=1 Tax=Streptosporangium sp. NPDC049376 TaxID=3366192 RepID=UPI0037A4946F